MSSANGKEVSSDVAGKWGVLVAERGFAQLPNYLLFLNQFLDEEQRLSPIELLVLIELAATWWKKSELPFPSMATLAARVGVSERQIQRAVTKLEKGQFLNRVKRRSSGIIASNAYDLAPLASVLEDVAKAFPNAFPRKTASAKKRLVLKKAGPLESPQEGPAGPATRVRVPRGVKRQHTAKPPATDQ